MSEHLDIETLSAHLDGHSGGAASRIEAHLGSCAQCAARRAALQRVVRSVATLPPVAPTAAEAGALRSAVLAGAGRGASPVPWFSRWRARMTWRLYAAGGAVAALLAGGIGYAAFEGGQAAVQASAVGHRAAAAIEAKAFANTSEVVVYVAQQPSVTDTVRTLTAAAIPTTLRQFQDMLAATPTPRATPGETPQVAAGGAPGATQAGAPALTTPQPAAPLGNGDASATGNGLAPRFAPAAPAPSLPPAVVPLVTCVATTQEGAGAPTAPLEATEITYRGAPAWLIVLAAFPPGASGATPPDSLQIWVQARPACSPLAHSSLAP